MDELAHQIAALREGVAPPWTEARRRRVHAGVIVSWRRRLRLRAAAYAGSAVLGLCTLGYLALRGSESTPRALQADVPANAVAAVEDRPPRATQGTRLGAGQQALLADGSHVQLAADSGELLIDGNQPEAIQLQLAAGSAHFDVVPHPTRRFVVVAGFVRVVVVGTAFDVERVQQRVRVAVSHGRVRVDSAAGEAFVQAGEERWFEQEAPAAREVRPKSRAARTPGPVPDEVEALLSAADAARANNQPELAARYLAQVLREHRGSSSTPVAAFTLGRLLLERLAKPAEAAEAFAVAHAASPRGSLAEDALAREVEAWSKAGRSDDAHRRATLFVESYPDSRRLALVKRYGGVIQP